MGKKGQKGENYAIEKSTIYLLKVHNLTQWEIDPGIVEDAPVAALQVVNAWDQVGIQGWFNFKSPLKSFFLKQSCDP